MIPRTAIPQIAEMIGRELNYGAEPSEEALAIGPILAEAGATPEIVGRLFAEAQRNRRNDRMIHAYAFMLEGALGTLHDFRRGARLGQYRASGQRVLTRLGAGVQLPPNPLRDLDDGGLWYHYRLLPL